MKTRLFVVWMIVALVAASLPGLAAAAPLDQPKKVDTVIGQVTAISGHTLDVQSRRGEVIKIQTDAQTRFRVRGAPEATIDDIQVGDTIVARGRRTDNVLNANVVLRVPDNLRDQAIGKVTSIEGRTLVLEDKDGKTIKVATNAATAFYSKGKPEATLADVKVGDMVTAIGALEGDSLAAARVRFNTPPARKPGPIALGEISAIQSGTLTLKPPFAEALTVNTNAATFVVKRSPEGPSVISLSDLKVGDKIMVIGPLSADHSAIEARVIVVGQDK